MALITNFLKGISDFFECHTEENGKNICFKHGVEHTGKTAYSILIDLFLYRKTGDKKYWSRVRRRALRIAVLQRQIGESHIFWPDGDKKWNMSNGIIDSGVAVDALSLLLIERKDKLADEEIGTIEQAIEKCCDTYLLTRVVQRMHTNQRLWGATGLAAAYQCMPKGEWKRAVMRSIEKSINEIRSDGSIPYVTEYALSGYHRGIQDITTYYHSRHIAFAWYALEAVGELSNEYIKRMQPAADFLIGMYQQNGMKNIQLETKRWYFDSSYEIGSHAYDIYVFAKYYGHTRNERYAHYVKRSFEQLQKHQVRYDGGIRDHIGGVENFQCPYFWNSHCAWLTRVDVEIEDIYKAKVDYDSSSHTLAYFKDADVLQVISTDYACTIRGSKQPSSMLWGTRIGGGSIIYFGLRKNTFTNSLTHRFDTDTWPLNFSLIRVHTLSFKELRSNMRNIRAYAFYILVEIRAGDGGSALRRFINLILALYNLMLVKKYSTGYMPNVASHADKERAIYTSGLSTMNGEVYEGITVAREYTLTHRGVLVKETLTTSNPVSGLFYLVPKSLAVHVNCDTPYVRRGNRIKFSRIDEKAVVSYELNDTFA